MLTLQTLEALGCHDGQMRSGELVHNGGWYDAEGTKVGWGDLTEEDLTRLAKDLTVDDGPLFILGERDSYWKFVKQVNVTNLPPTGFSHDVDRDNEQKPTLEYVLEKARWIVFLGRVFIVDAYNERKDGDVFRRFGEDVDVFFIRRETVQRVFSKPCIDEIVLPENVFVKAQA